jgi:hypothetical protein
MVTLIDEVGTGPATPAVAFEVPEPRLTAREIVRRRVLVEIELREADAGRRVDADRQIAAAERAFERNGFLLFVGDRQIEDLEESVELASDVEVTFLMLIPLAGG